MRVIIAGGSGLVGRALTAHLCAAGHEVVVLSRSPRRGAGLPESARVLEWDARTRKNWEHLVDADSAIVNLAGANIGEERWTASRKETISRSRLNASAAVVDAVESAKEKPNVVVQASAVGFYGNRGNEILTESSEPGRNDFPSDVCRQLERAIQPVAEATRLTIIRTGVVLSSQGGALPKMLTPFKLFAGGPCGDGKQWFPWIHISDEVRAIAFLLDNDSLSGVFNLTAPGILTNKDFAAALGAALSRPSMIPAPAPALRLALGEMATLVLDGQRAVSTKLQDAGFIFEHGEVRSALRDIIKNRL